MKEMKMNKYPLKSTRRELYNAKQRAKRKLKKNLTKRQMKWLKTANKRKSTLEKNTICRNKKCSIRPNRLQYHKQLINKKFRDKSSIDKKDPDLYIIAGIPASGKTTMMMKRIPEKVLSISADEYKEQLAKRSKSPFKKYKLFHAGILHPESQYLANKSIKRGIKEKRDIVLELTLSNLNKKKRLINKFKKAGYDTHLLGTQKTPHLAMDNAVDRFLDAGRYMPLFQFTKKGNRTNRNVLKARKVLDSHIIIDTDNWDKPKTIYKSKRGLKYNFRDPKRK